MKKRLSVLAATAAVSLAASAASASVIAYEGFDYSAGTIQGNSNPSTGNNWLRAGTATTPTALNVVSGSLTMPSTLTPAITGNSLAITGIGNGNGSSNRLAFPAVTSGTVYYSMALRVDALTGSNSTTGGFCFAFNNTGNSSQTTNPGTAPARLQMRIDPSDASKYDLGIFSNASATATASTWSSGLSVGDTIFVVGAYTFNTGGATDDVSSLWISPAAGTLGQPTAPAATLTSVAGTDVGQIASILVRQSPAPYVTLDEIRVGTSWADVTDVPEPASLGVMGLAGLGLLRRRRR